MEDVDRYSAHGQMSEISVALALLISMWEAGLNVSETPTKFEVSQSNGWRVMGRTDTDTHRDRISLHL